MSNEFFLTIMIVGFAVTVATSVYLLNLVAAYRRWRQRQHIKLEGKRPIPDTKEIPGGGVQATTSENMTTSASVKVVSVARQKCQNVSSKSLAAISSLDCLPTLSSPQSDDATDELCKIDSLSMAYNRYVVNVPQWWWHKHAWQMLDCKQGSAEARQPQGVVVADKAQRKKYTVKRTRSQILHVKVANRILVENPVGLSRHIPITNFNTASVVPNGYSYNLPQTPEFSDRRYANFVDMS